MQTTPEQIHSTLDAMMQSNFPQFKLCDAELGQNGYRLGEQGGYLRIGHNDAWVSFELTGNRGPHDSLVRVTEQHADLMRFKLKLITLCDSTEVDCVQYRDAKRKGVHIQVNIPAKEASVALATAVVETFLLDYI
jgi:hypothetical protein